MNRDYIDNIRRSIASKINRQERRFLSAVCAIAAIDNSADHDHILTFISSIRNSFPDATHVYTNGACYKFYLILKSIFACAQPYYDVNHVITKIGDKYYDITGEVTIGRHFPLLDHPMVHERVKRECEFPAIMDHYEKLKNSYLNNK